MRTLLLAVMLGLAVYKLVGLAALATPLVLTIHQTVGMAPLTLRVKVKSAVEGREVCVVVDGPESYTSCRTLDNVTWTQDFELRTGGEYVAYATGGAYRTPDVPIRVIGLGEPE